MCINTSSHWELHTASLVSQTLKLHTAEGHLSWKTALSINRLTRLSNHLSSLPSLLISRAIDIVSVLRRFPWKTVTACSLLLLTLSSYGSFSFIPKKSDPATCRHKIFGGICDLRLCCVFYHRCQLQVSKVTAEPGWMGKARGESNQPSFGWEGSRREW